VNLPNAITAARIAVAPAIALLPFHPSWAVRLGAFWLFIVAAVSDHVDGKLARDRGLVTNLGKILDPLADKLLLVATFIPMYLLVGSGPSWGVMSPHQTPLAAGVLGPMARGLSEVAAYPLLTPFGAVGLPWWVLAVVIGREAFMTVFRQAAVRKGVFIAAIGPAKWKTGFQWTWVGATYFWFFAASLALTQGWDGAAWRAVVYFISTVALVSMVGAFVLTLYSLWLYMREYGGVIFK
jgi:CDP-diacylglycerol---glycerol-3-phosphate 3-phosphatidyltransferase